MNTGENIKPLERRIRQIDEQIAMLTKLKSQYAEKLNSNRRPPPVKAGVVYNGISVTKTKVFVLVQLWLPFVMVDPKGLTLWGAFKKRWISFLETAKGKIFGWGQKFCSQFYSVIQKKRGICLGFAFWPRSL